MEDYSDLVIEAWEDQVRLYDRALADSARLGSNIGVEFVRQERERTLGLIRALKASEEASQDDAQRPQRTEKTLTQGW